MTAHNAHRRHKTEQIGVKEQARKAVFVKRKMNPVKILVVPLKADSEHKAEKSDYIKNGSGDNHKIRQKVKLVFKVKVLFRMHSVKNKEADEHMEEHNHADKRGKRDIKQYSEQRKRHKRANPNSEAHIKKRVETAQVYIDKHQTPDKQKRKQNITEELDKRKHTQKQVDNIYFSEK